MHQLQPESPCHCLGDKPHLHIFTRVQLLSQPQLSTHSHVCAMVGTWAQRAQVLPLLPTESGGAGNDPSSLGHPFSFHARGECSSIALLEPYRVVLLAAKSPASSPADFPALSPGLCRLPVFAVSPALLLLEIIARCLSQVHCCHLPALHQLIPVVAPDHNWHWGHIYSPRGIWAFLHSFSPCPGWRCTGGWLKLPGKYRSRPGHC